MNSSIYGHKAACLFLISLLLASYAMASRAVPAGIELKYSSVFDDSVKLVSEDLTMEVTLRRDFIPAMLSTLRVLMKRPRLCAADTKSSFI